MVDGIILEDIRRAILGENADEEAFDADLIMHANAVFVILRQLGIGPNEGFAIETKKEKWSDFCSDTVTVNLVKSYMVAKIRLIFDPPTNGSVLEALKQFIAEFEWRGNVDVETDWSKSK